MSNLYTIRSYEKITLPKSKSITRRQKLPFTYNGVTSSLAIDLPWRQECQIHIPASASCDATDVNASADDLICRRPFFFVGKKMELYSFSENSNPQLEVVSDVLIGTLNLFSFIKHFGTSNHFMKENGYNIKLS